MKREEEAGSGAEMSIPPLFRCPISLELFSDPVTLCTGQTYDRPSIQKWISSGNFTCPVTMQRLHDLSMVPNHALSHLIQLWLNQTAQAPSLVGPHPSHDDHLAALKRTLVGTHEPTWEKKVLALRQVRVLTSELSNREIESLIRFGFFQILIKLGFDREMVNTHQGLEVVELALSSAVKLMPFSDLNLLKEEKFFAAFPTLLEKGTALVKTLVCQILEGVLSSQSQETKELANMIRSSDQIQRLIINLINDYHEDENTEVSEAGVKVILAFCSKGSESSDHHGQRQLVQLGAIKALVRYTTRALNREGGAVAAAVAAVEELLKVEGGKQALLGEPSGVKTLVKMVFRVNDHHGSESAVNCLMGLCGGSATAREAAVKSGVVTQLLLLIQSQSGWRVKARAGVLLKLLRTMWTNGSPNRNHEGSERS